MKILIFQHEGKFAAKLEDGTYVQEAENTSLPAYTAHIKGVYPDAELKPKSVRHYQTAKTETLQDALITADSVEADIINHILEKRAAKQAKNPKSLEITQEEFEANVEAAAALVGSFVNVETETESFTGKVVTTLKSAKRKTVRLRVKVQNEKGEGFENVMFGVGNKIEINEELTKADLEQKEKEKQERKEKLEKAKQEKQRQKQENKAKKQKVKRLEEEAKSFKQDVKSEERKLNNLVKAIEAGKQRIAKFEEKIAKEQQELGELALSLGEQKAEVEAAKQRLEDHNSTFAELQLEQTKKAAEEALQKAEAAAAKAAAAKAKLRALQGITDDEEE